MGRGNYFRPPAPYIQKSYISIANPCIFCSLGQLLASISPHLSLRCGPANCCDHGDGVLDNEEVVLSNGSNMSRRLIAKMSTNHSMGRVHSWRIYQSLKKKTKQIKETFFFFPHFYMCLLILAGMCQERPLFLPQLAVSISYVRKWRNYFKAREFPAGIRHHWFWGLR